MNPYIYEIRLPSRAADLLKAMVDMAQKHQVLTLECYEITSAGYVISIGNDSRQFDHGPDDTIYALEMLGLVGCTPKKVGRTIFLRNIAYEWVSYERKWRISKWIQRTWHNHKYIFLGVLPAIVSVITTFLTIWLYGLQILEGLIMLGWIKIP